MVSNNYIGGNAANCSGTFTKTSSNNIFYGIFIYVGFTTATNVQGNVIKNISWANSGNSSFYGMCIDNGLVNIGTTSGNTIGASTGTGSITYTAGATGAICYGIKLNSYKTVDCQNNTIGSITVAASNSANATNFIGINKSYAGNATISNNTIGSTTDANSINASSQATGNAQYVYGIYNTGSETVTISNNTIANLTNGTTNTTTSTTGVIQGIAVTSGTNTITNNTIRNLTIANANTDATNNASAVGIMFNNTTAAAQTISQNTIYNISNTYGSYTGNVIGIYYNGSTTASNVSRNFVHSLSVNSSSTSANIYGIKINAGATTYSNNIISLGGNTQTTLYGIYETGSSSNNNNLYFNTVYLSGAPTAGTRNSYALYSNASTNTRDFRNNIFVNARSNSGASGKHYAAYFNYTTNANLTLNYNDYYVSGTGGVLGFYNSADVTSLPLVTSMDANSKNVNPEFQSAGGTVAANYKTSNRTIIAQSGTGISIDYAGTSREPNYPTMGAYENDNPLPVELVSFSAMKSSTSTSSVTAVVLKWVTATEVNNYGFEIQRLVVSDQPSANSWQKIAFVQGHGNSNSPKSYSFVDAKAPAGKVQYRLKQIDFDGKYEYSEVVEVNVEAPAAFLVKQNYPNPFNPSTVISYHLPVNSQVTLKVYDVLGREVATLVNETQQAGVYNVNFNASHLASGMYMYKVQAGNFTQIKKMLLVK